MMLRNLMLLLLFPTVLITTSACGDSKVSAEEKTEIDNMDSTSKAVEDSTKRLEEQTRKVEESLERLDKEFENDNQNK